MMSYIRKFRSLLVVGIIAAFPASAPADAPVGQFDLQFSPSQGIWDVTGNYPSVDFDVIANELNLFQDEKGKITGTGTGTGTDQGITLDLVHNITGSIKGVDDVTRVLLTLKVSGTATDGVNTLPVNGSIKLTLDLDIMNNILIGSGVARLCIRGRCARSSGPVQFDIPQSPQPMDGNWELALDLQSPDNKKIIGTAVTTLSNGRVIPLTVSGNYSAAKLLTELNLKGEGGRVTLQNDTSQWALTRAKLLGQKVPTSPRPVDLMLVLDRSGSMGETDGAGRTKISALKCALTGLGCGGSGFLGENFASDDRVGMTAFGKRGCGTGGSGEFTGNVCVPDKPLGSSISSIAAAVDALGLSGTTNTMEGLRTGKTEIANAFTDPARSVTRKVVLLITDGQPTALRLDGITACQSDPLTGTPLGGPAFDDSAGCFFVKMGNSTSTTVSAGLTRFRLNTNCDEHFGTTSNIPNDGCGETASGGSGSPSPLYLNQMQAARNATREEARQIKELGGGSALVFVIAIGQSFNPDPTARLDANARCLLAAIANDKALIEDPSTDPQSGSCSAVYTTTQDQDTHNDLKGVNKPVFNPDHQGKVYTVDLNGDVQTQLQVILNEIAAILKFRLVS